MSRIDENTFVQTWLQFKGHVPSVAKALGVSERHCFKRRSVVEQNRGIVLPSGSIRPDAAKAKEYVEKIGHRITLNLKDGMAVIFGDAHYWPGDNSIAHQALVRFIKEHKPSIIVCNGDAFDGAAISRHPPTSWAKMPDVADELAYCQQMIGEIEEAAPPKSKLVWCMGNHDTRFSSRLAQTAPQYVRVHGTDLPDHFDAWNFSWSCQINDNVMVKHRWHGSIHGAYNNTLKGGKSIVTGHTHRLQAIPYADYNGLRWGIETGTLSDFGPDVQKFTYGEDAPFNWCQGFVVLTFHLGRMLEPEFVRIIDRVPFFRGVSLLAQSLALKPHKKTHG
jgi:predicted phosphodiesterase